MTRHELLEMCTAQKLDILSSFPKYQDFLEFAAKHYKQGMANAIVLQAQNHNATAIASGDFWQKIKMPVPAGEKGLHVFSEKAEGGVNSRMFDVLQTKSNRDISPLIWQYDESNINVLRESLASDILTSNTDDLATAYFQLLDDLPNNSVQLFAAYSAAVITAHRIKIQTSDDAYAALTRLFTKLSVTDRRVALVCSFGIAAETLKKIERGSRHDRNRGNKWEHTGGSRQQNLGEGQAVGLSENGEQLSLYFGMPSGWNADLLPGVSGDSGSRERPNAGGGTTPAIQQVLPRISEREQAGNIRELDDGVRATGAEVQNRQGLLGALRQLGRATGKIVGQDTSEGGNIRAEFGKSELDIWSSQRADNAVYVGDIRTGNTAGGIANGIAKKGLSGDGPFFVGDEIELDGRSYKIDAIDTQFDKALLLDLTFLHRKGYPVFNAQVLSALETRLGNRIFEEREERAPLIPQDAVRELPPQTLTEILQDKSDTPTLAALIASAPPPKDEPEKIDTPKIDWSMLDDFNQSGGVKAKAQANIEAIKALYTVRAEGRNALAQEQAIMSHYTGWGGMPMVFDASNAAFVNEYKTLKELLTEDEYKAAKASTLTAFYTSKPIIDGMYQAIKSFGFSSGNILEPSCGTGNFIGCMPTRMRHASNVYGVELDSLSAGIAEQLYQTVNIDCTSLQNATFNDNYFDVAIGNIPFGDIKVADAKYDKHNFYIHDYFFAKTIDKTKPSGVIAFITSKGTLDKKDSRARRYIFERCDLIGAIRLPNNAFKAAGTEVTSDVIFLQKREHARQDNIPYLDVTDIGGGIEINEYFAQHKDMMLGVMTKDSNMYGSDNITTLSPINDGKSIGELFMTAISKLSCTMKTAMVAEPELDAEETIPIDEHWRNFCFGELDGKIYYRQNDTMVLQKLTPAQATKVKGYCMLRDTLRELLEKQTRAEVTDDELGALRQELNARYDAWAAKYGDLNDKNNLKLVETDADINLVRVLTTRQDGETVKMSIFTQRTVAPIQEIKTADTALDALAISLNHCGEVNFEYIKTIYDKPSDEVIAELRSKIYRNPKRIIANEPFSGYEPADEYLSGDIREKLSVAKIYAETNPELLENIEALKTALPVAITAGEIDVRLGATWVDCKYYNQFIYELLKTSPWKRATGDTHYNSRVIEATYSAVSGSYKISNTKIDNNAAATEIYGSKRINGYQIIEESLNLRDVVIKDAVPHVTRAGNDSVKYVVNAKETAIARQKQEAVRKAFKDWIFSDPKRREELTETYNKIFNSIKHRTYDGGTLSFPGMAEAIKLQPHQCDAVARLRSGNNTLLAHVVGAGKTYTMIAGAKEQLRIGLCNKAMFVVPNHLIPQFTDDILLLYPNAKLLSARKKDFERANRQQFLSRIAMSDANMIVIGHSQFEKIMMSPEYQSKQIAEDIDELTEAISEAKQEVGNRITVKQLEKMKLSLEVQLEKLNDTTKKDKMLTFEQLGVNSLFVDEAHYYKNCAIFSKMRNISGISNARAKKSSDMLMKTKYINESGGIVTFATGTPISNSIAEAYVMQRYLQNDLLRRRGIRHFDDWAGTFGETKTSLELAPEGGGYRLKTRFASFYNLPELMQLFCETADIQTKDMLNLPTPALCGDKAQVISCEPSAELLEFMAEGVERVSAIRNGEVEPQEDNMLKFISDFRKAGLDMRLIDPNLPCAPDSKLVAAADIIYDQYINSTAVLGTQLVFCDTSTYNPQRPFDVYREEKRLLVAHGVPENEIAFIHTAKTEKEKEAMFEKVRSGEIRILIGSTQKCGAGTNIQDRLIALHHLDCPYRPSDIEQREGRILRQGNNNAEVSIYRYVTKRSFDAYLWNIVEGKQKFISQLMRGENVSRRCDDLDETSIGFAEAQAIASGDPRIKEKIELDTEVQRLNMLLVQHRNDQYRIQDAVDTVLPSGIQSLKAMITDITADINMRDGYNAKHADFEIKLGSKVFTKREEAGEYLSELLSAAPDGERTVLGSFQSMELLTSKGDSRWVEPKLILKGKKEYAIELGASDGGNITRVENQAKGMELKLRACQQELSDKKQSLESLKQQYGKPFEAELELEQKLNRQAELNVMLDVGGKEDILVVDDEKLQTSETEISDEQDDEQDDEFEME